MRYIIGAIYISGDRSPDILTKSHTRKNNVSFVKTFSPMNGSVLKLYSIIAIQSLRNIDREDALYLSNSSKYTFLNDMSSCRNRYIV